MYAEDHVLFAQSEEVLQKICDQFVSAAADIGLTINSAKVRSLQFSCFCFI